MEPVVAIVVAAGSGSRLGGVVPKALREVCGRPIVVRSVEALAAGGVDRAVVVVPAGLEPAFAQALALQGTPTTVVSGGAQRQDSVRAGIRAIEEDPELAASRYVLVHDAARALVPSDVVRRVIRALRNGAVGCVPVVPVVDSLRELLPAGSSRVVDRAQLRAVQTPQGFDRVLLSTAHDVVAREGALVTDDAAALELLGEPVTLVDGSADALKITGPLDLLLAEAIVRSRQ